MAAKRSSLPHALLGGAASALLFLSVAHFPNMGTAILSFISSLPLFMVGLADGRRSALISAVTASALILALAHPIQGLSYAILYALPIVILVNRALLNRKQGKLTEWYPAGQLVLWLTALTCLIVITAVIMISPLTEPEQLKDTFGQLAPMLGPQPEETLKALTRILPYFPAFFGVSWFLQILINGVLAQGLLSRFKANQRTSPTLSDLVLPQWMLALTATSIVLAFVNFGIVSQLAGNLAPVLLIPFTLVGLGFIHRQALRTPAPQFFLVLFYVFVILLIWPFILLSTIGAILTFISRFK